MSSSETDTVPEKIFNGTVRLLRQEDLFSIRPILETWIRWEKKVLTEEIEETLKAMEESISGQNNRTFFVAVSANNKVVGVMGMKDPEEKMIPYTKTDKPVELINAFVSKDYRRQGIGKALVGAIENQARQKGYKELVLNSGPRYQFSGWAAWKKIFGEPAAIAKDFYGEGWDAPVWRKIL